MEFCKDQHGSRFIQLKLETASDEEKQLIFKEISQNSTALMMDIFANYVVQKLFEFGNQELCEILGAKVKENVLDLSQQMYGCRVVQRALEFVPLESLLGLIRAFDGPNITDYMQHQHFNHVIQKCVEVVSVRADRVEALSPGQGAPIRTNIDFILEAIVDNEGTKAVSTHPFGCRVVQRVLEFCDGAQKTPLLEELCGMVPALVQDQYGNYVMQHMLRFGRPEDRALIFQIVHDNFIVYSTHKFASNVVEKCLHYGTEKERDAMVWAMIKETFNSSAPVDQATGESTLEAISRDPFGNYVVQKVIDVCTDEQRAAIVEYVKNKAQQLARYTYGKHIISRLEKG